MNNVKRIREFLQYSPEQFASLLRTKPANVLEWEVGTKEPDYDSLKFISQIFHLSADFVKGIGIFRKWDQILEYYDAISWQLQTLIPDGFFLPTFCEDKFLNVWLDTRLYFEPDELALARWFAFAIDDIQFTSTGEDEGGNKTVDLDVVFTPAFNAIIRAVIDSQSMSTDRRRKVIRLAGEDGSFVVYDVNDDMPKSREQVIKDFLDSLDRPDDENI